MQQRAIRRSGRVNLEIPIQVSGRDRDGKVFSEETKTLVVSLLGAKIFLSASVSPDVHLSVRNLKRGNEGLGRIVWRRDLVPSGYHVGIEFLDSDANFRDIEFPMDNLGQDIAASFLLECSGCHAQRVFDLDSFAVEQLQSAQPVLRPCARCNRLAMWRLPLGHGASSP